MAKGGGTIVIVAAMVGALGGLLSSAGTSYFTRSRELEKSLFEFKQKAYADFLKAQSLLQASKEESPEERKANQAITDAKLRILMTEPRGVVCAMATYWVQYNPTVKDCAVPEEKKKDVAIYQAMREEFFRGLGLKTAELDPSVLVPYLRGCVLSRDDLKKACPGP